VHSTLETAVDGRVEKNKAYEGVTPRVGFGSMKRIILALRFQDASSSSDSTLRFFGRNGGGVLGKEIR
jgi:hypothetical protein